MLPDTFGNWQNMALTKNKRDEFLIEIRKSKSSNLIKQKRFKMCEEMEKINNQMAIQEEHNIFQENTNSIQPQSQQEESLSEKV